MKKLIAFLVCMSIVCAVFAMTVFATTEAISPFANNTSDCICALNINSYGHATMTVSCYAYQSIVTNTKITIQLQKKFLGLFWRNVDGQYWEYTSSQVNYSYQNTVQLSDTGKYRIVVNFTVYGVEGKVDQLEKTAESEW